jgi:hypothetical protein
MHFVGNALNGEFFKNLVLAADRPELEHIRLAVAYVRQMNDIFDLARKREVPLTLYALMDGDGFPALPVLKRFVEASPISWRLFLTANFYHPKIYWFQGVGAYIGSANLTDSGWNRNMECGLWLEEEELEATGMTDELRAMFAVIGDRCVPASAEHIAIVKRLEDARADLLTARKVFETEAQDALRNLPGQVAPIDVTKRDRPGGAARKAFVAEWHQTLTLLRKLTEQVKAVKWPDWVDDDVHPAIAQDQATEYWYQQNIRRTGQSAAEVERLHRSNIGRTERAVAEMFKFWLEGDVGEDWAGWTNSTPRRLRTLLSREHLARLDAEHLTEILWGGHASREHARQIKNSDFGLASTEHHTKEERCEMYAHYLLSRETADGKGIALVLDYVLWGDDQSPDCADRIWDATRDPKWRLPHLGVNILGELVGYARPDDFPPRNNRVSRCLVALGFEGVSA